MVFWVGKLNQWQKPKSENLVFSQIVSSSMQKPTSPRQAPKTIVARANIM